MTTEPPIALAPCLRLTASYISGPSRTHFVSSRAMANDGEEQEQKFGMKTMAVSAEISIDGRQKVEAATPSNRVLAPLPQKSPL